jgi:hypothetical protein
VGIFETKAELELTHLALAGGKSVVDETTLFFFLYASYETQELAEALRVAFCVVKSGTPAEFFLRQETITRDLINSGEGSRPRDPRPELLAFSRQNEANKTLVGRSRPPQIKEHISTDREDAIPPARWIA